MEERNEERVEGAMRAEKRWDEEVERQEERYERYQKGNQRGESDMHPLLWNKLYRPRTVFTPGHRVSMNIVPMFLNVFIPWAFFVVCSASLSFSFRYNHPTGSDLITTAAFLLWVVTVVVALWARRGVPEPTWYTYLALMVGVGVFFGCIHGERNWSMNTLKYFQINDLKTIHQVDANLEHGQNVMDAGIVYFAQNSGIDADKSWHFKHGTMYCVVPITSGGEPATHSYDFWAVGKDCCSMSSSDFRCGDAALPRARSAIRVMDNADLEYYSLAVEQASALYGITTNHPVFFEWKQSPQDIVNGWNADGFKTFIRGSAMFFVLCLLAVALATMKFSWIGRGEAVYDMDFYNDDGYGNLGFMEGVDLRRGMMFAA